MTRRIACAAVLACPLVLGCGGLFRIGTRNLVNEAKLIRDEHRERLRYCSLAHEAWQRVQANCPEQAYSVHYAAGFKDGFVDYLYAGGCGEPPALPPKCYRHFHGESAQGVQSLQDWYAGFRHGAAVAKESGLRQFVLVSLPPPPGAPLPPPPPPRVPPVPPPPAPPAAVPGRANPQPTPASSYLPTPRPIPADVPPGARSEPPGEDKIETPETLPPGNESLPPSEPSEPSDGSSNDGPAIQVGPTDPPAREEQS
jgi:hypothetical protein